MAICQICNEEMKKVIGCTEHIYLLNDGTEIKAVKAGDQGDQVEKGEKCEDCGAAYGEYHHVGCNMERCGNCGGQYISCDCDYSDEIIIVKYEIK